jgi:hypothetical protein
MCLPLEATTGNSGVARCTVAIFNVLSSDAPSESVDFVVQSQGKYSIHP